MRTSAKRSSFVTSSGTLMAATLPVTPSKTCGRVLGLWVGIIGRSAHGNPQHTSSRGRLGAKPYLTKWQQQWLVTHAHRSVMISCDGACH